jgi:hypothetical protein
MKAFLFSKSTARFLLAGLFPALAASVFAGSPVLETRFNNSDNLDLQNGAVLGAAASGVSGQTDDKCYSAEAPNWPAGSKGPAVVPGPGTPVAGATELTVTAWYKPRAALQNDTMLFSACGTGLIWDEKTNQWTLRIEAVPTDAGHKMYWFASGNDPKSGYWVNPGEWTFIAMVWSSSGKSVVFYRGGRTAESAPVRTSTRPETVLPFSEKPDSKRIIGNRGREMDRPFNGEIDDVRFFTKALDAGTVEKIRQADLKNQDITLP